MCWVCTMVSFDAIAITGLKLRPELVERQVAPAVGFPRFHQAHVTLQRALHDVATAVEFANLLAHGHLGADAGGGEERGNAGARGTHAFGEGALRDDLQLDLAGAIEAFEHHRIGGARERADDLADTPELHQACQSDVADASVVGRDDEVGGALLDQSVDQRVGLADGAEAANQHDGTILDVRHGIGHGLDDFIDHAGHFLRRSAAMLRHGRTDAKGGPLARCPRACKTGSKGAIRQEANMPETASSAAEAALENQKIGSLQLRVAALCTLVQICDGYDLNSVAWAVPSLIRSWHLAPALFTTAFLWSSIGIMVGALSAGPIGDRFGRRPLLLGSLTIFGIASLLTASAGSLETLTLWRFFTGIGIGGGFSGAAALTGDYTPHRLRATMIMASFTGAPAGGFIGGQLVAVLLRHYDWPVIFVVGGVFPLNSGSGTGRLAAGVAALPGQEAKPVAASDGVAAASRHRTDAKWSG